ncbi:hypothetical protein [uncultured Methanobrevibacter sp.]|uniref:hypothetical protein n=1 Tax=uncultured Methanobrevibacter sp. TaxID=253161 RepID=UPI0025E9B490|nr:hypothetical protein [uncultured Methanobrevibacter sp.]
MGLFDRFKKSGCGPTNEQKELAEIAKNSTDKDVACEAAEKITDLSLLVDLTYINPNEPIYNSRRDVHGIAVGNINDEKTLKNMLLTHSNSVIRYLVLEKIISLGLDDESTMLEVVKNEDDSGVRWDAFRRIKDKSSLEYIAKYHPDYDYRISALVKLEDVDGLRYIFENTTDKLVRQHAAEELSEFGIEMDILISPEDVNDVTDADKLIDIAKNAVNPDSRKNAIEKISDNNVLADVARNDNDDSVKAFAREKISDDSILAEVNEENIAIMLDYFHNHKYYSYLTDSNKESIEKRILEGRSFSDKDTIDRGISLLVTQQELENQ